MTREEIRDLVIKAAVNTEELTDVVDAIFKEIAKAYDEGYNQGRYDPEFDTDDGS